MSSPSRSVRRSLRRVLPIKDLLPGKPCFQHDDVVDLDKDITIFLDGTRKFDGRATRKIKTMLEVAAEDWEFQRLWPVRFDLSQRGRAVQD